MTRYHQQNLTYILKGAKIRVHQCIYYYYFLYEYNINSKTCFTIYNRKKKYPTFYKDSCQIEQKGESKSKRKENKEKYFCLKLSSELF